MLPGLYGAGVGGLGLSLMEQRPFQVFVRCPFMMFSASGKNLAAVSWARPDQV